MDSDDIEKLLKQLSPYQSLVEQLRANSASSVFEQARERSLAHMADQLRTDAAYASVQQMVDRSSTRYLIEQIQRERQAKLELLAGDGHDIQRLLRASEPGSFRAMLELSEVDAGRLRLGYDVQELAKSVRTQSALGELAAHYAEYQDAFATSLFEAARRLRFDPHVTFDDPDAEDIEELEEESSSLPADDRRILASVEFVPLRLLTRILRNPDEIRDLTPRQFEGFVAEAIHELGFEDIILTPRSRDGGKDVIASYNAGGIPVSFYFECKHYASGKVQVETLRALLGTISNDNVNKGVLVTSSTFTRGAHEFILGNQRLDGKDYDGLLGWIDIIRRKSN